MCEEESDSCSQLVEFSCKPDYRRLRAAVTSPASSTRIPCGSGYDASCRNLLATGTQQPSIVYALASTAEARAIISCQSSLEGGCCCDGRVHRLAGSVRASDGSTSISASQKHVERHQFCGWDNKKLPAAVGHSHIVIRPECSSQTGLSSTNSRAADSCGKPSTSSKSNNSLHQFKRTDSSNNHRSQLRSYIHREAKGNSYKFVHLTEKNDISLHIDRYRKMVTYPKMEQSGGAAAPVEMTLWSGRCVQSSVVVKPKLFIIGKEPATLHTRPYTSSRKNYSQGQSTDAALDRSRLTKFRLPHSSNVMSTVLKQSRLLPSGQESVSDQLVLPGRQMPLEYSHHSEPKPCPVSIVGSFSSLQAEKGRFQSSEDDFVTGGEEDNDAQLSMTWVTQPVPESFLVSSVTYTTPTSKGIAKRRATSIPSKTSSLGFKGGSKNINTLRTTNKGGKGSFKLAVAGQRPLSSGAGKKKLTYNTLQLSTQSVPLIKSEKAFAKTNKLGHLLNRKQRSDDWRAHTNICANGIY